VDIIEAVLQHDLEQIIKLLAEGIDPNACDDKAAITPLHYAAQQNFLEAVPHLIAAGAKLDAMSWPDGETPLKIAQINGHQQMVSLLAHYLQNKSKRKNH
jgi:uncharacterized protein